MASVYVSIGSNIDKEKNVPTALQAIQEVFGDLLVSSFYQTTAVGFDGDDFYNLAAGLMTRKAPLKIAKILRQIEHDHGRDRGGDPFSSRTLDLDLLLYDDLVMQDAELQLPRSEITEYPFVLCPLAEIAGNVSHPTLNLTFQRLWDDMKRSGITLPKKVFDSTQHRFKGWPMDSLMN